MTPEQQVVVGDDHPTPGGGPVGGLLGTAGWDAGVDMSITSAEAGPMGAVTWSLR